MGRRVDFRLIILDNSTRPFWRLGDFLDFLIILLLIAVFSVFRLVNKILGGLFLRLNLLNIFDLLVGVAAFLLLFVVFLREDLRFLDILIDFFILVVGFFGVLWVPIFLSAIVMALGGFVVDGGEFGGLGGRLVVEVEKLIVAVIGLFGFFGLFRFGVEILEVELFIPFGHE